MIRELEIADIVACQVSSFIWKIYLDYEGSNVTALGQETFHEYITEENLSNEMSLQRLKIWGYFSENQLVGIIGLRPEAHICLLFVASTHQKMGIAKQLLRQLIAAVSSLQVSQLTVNSSCYAEEIYKRMGFSATASKQTVNGITFIPMRYLLIDERDTE